MALSDETTRLPELKRVIQHAAHFVGLHVGRYPPVDSLAYHLKTVFHELKIDVVLDVGAHVGEYARFLREIPFEGEIISFEPVGESFARLARLKEEHGDTSWHLENLALGPAEGEMQMNVFRGSVFNSFLQPTDDASRRFREETEQVGTEAVRVRRLESIVDEIRGRRPDARIFLKMDTQGFDLEVLGGAGRHLADVLALQTELAARPTYAGMPTLPESLTRLSALGFDLTGMFPVARELDHLRLIELDCVMCRSRSGD